MGSESPDMPSSNQSISDENERTPRILITAGPTHEPLDGVRYLANRSSGRLGLQLAGAATMHGAKTTLLLGPTPLEPIEHSLLEVERFQTTSDLEALLSRAWPDHDLLLMTAAVADYRPRHPLPEGKHQRTRDGLTLDLEATPDLLKGLAEVSRPDQIRVGWALEPKERLLERTRSKLESKHLQAIVGNPIDTLDAETIAPVVLVKEDEGDRRLALPSSAPMTKTAFAAWLIEQCLELCRAVESGPAK